MFSTISNKLVQPYLYAFVNSNEQQGSIFDASKHSAIISKHPSLRIQHPHKQPFNSKKHPKLSLSAKEVPNTATLNHKVTFGAPDLNPQFTEESNLDHCLLKIFNNYWLAPEDKTNLFQCHIFYKTLDNAVKTCRAVFFYP